MNVALHQTAESIQGKSKASRRNFTTTERRLIPTDVKGIALHPNTTPERAAHIGDYRSFS